MINYLRRNQNLMYNNLCIMNEVLAKNCFSNVINHFKTNIIVFIFTLLICLELINDIVKIFDFFFYYDILSDTKNELVSRWCVFVFKCVYIFGLEDFLVSLTIWLFSRRKLDKLR